MFRTDFLFELVHWIDGRIHVASKALLCLSESRYDVPERNAANHHQVDVAPGAHGPLGCGPIDESNLDR